MRELSAAWAGGEAPKVMAQPIRLAANTRATRDEIRISAEGELARHGPHAFACALTGQGSSRSPRMNLDAQGEALRGAVAHSGPRT